MTVLLTVAFAVAFLLALLDGPLYTLSIFFTPRAVNAVVSVGFSYLGLFLLQPARVVDMVINSIACAFLARTSLHISEKAASYRVALTRPGDDR